MTSQSQLSMTDQLVHGSCTISPRMRPRLGTMVGTGHGPIIPAAVQARLSRPTVQSDLIIEQRNRSSINLEHVTQRRRERILDWPQFRLRRKPTSPLGNGWKRCKAEAKSELGCHRYPIKAVHPISMSDRTRCSTHTKESVVKTNGLADHNRSTETQHNTETTVSLGRSRRGISTNPHVRRRYSADGIPIHSDDVIAPSPAKRIHPLPGSATIQHGRSMNTLSHDIFPKLNETNEEDDNLTLIRIPTWHQLSDQNDLSPQSNRRQRHSVDSAQRNTQSETHIPSSTKQSGRRKSQLLNDLRRSARQTLDTLCKALRNSTTNLTDSEKQDSSRMVTAPVGSTPRRHSDMALNHHTSESLYSLTPTELGTRIEPNQRYYPEKQVTKVIELRRNNLQEPFGLFVTKSDVGFRVTRLSDNLPNTSPGLKELQVGDELIQVNGLQCTRLSLVELRKHFSECTALLLTVRSNGFAPQPC